MSTLAGPVAREQRLSFYRLANSDLLALASVFQHFSMTRPTTPKSTILTIVLGYTYGPQNTAACRSRRHQTRSDARGKV